MERDSGNIFVKPQIVTTPIDVVVPCHNLISDNFNRGLSLTVRCIQALYSHTGAPFHLIVVDDSPGYLTSGYFKELKKFLGKRGKDITYIQTRNEVKKGKKHRYQFKEGNEYLNLAFRHARTPYIACMGNSIRVEPDWEIVALNILKSDSTVGIVGYKNLFPEGAFGNSIESAGITMVNYTPVDIGRDLPSHRQTALYECPAVQWAFAMVRKDAVVDPYMQEGVFNGFKGWDDIDNCFALRKRGWKVMYDGYGVGYHFPRATRGSNTKEAHKLNQENARRFYKRWGYWDKFISEYPKAPDGKDWPEGEEGAVIMPE